MKNKQTNVNRDGDVLKGLASGIVGGLVASVAMNQFQKLLSKLTNSDERSHGAQSLQQGSPQHGIGRKLEKLGKDEPEDDAAGRLANAVSVGISGRELTEKEKEVGGTALHYAYGISMGAVYGAAAEILPETTIGGGMPFGALIWLGADEGVVPLLGLSKAPTEYPLSIHASALASHLVYGLTAEAVRRVVRNVL